MSDVLSPHISVKKLPLSAVVEPTTSSPYSSSVCASSASAAVLMRTTSAARKIAMSFFMVYAPFIPV